ncbi:HD domain-containing phosphohydrolase [Clostridium sp. DL1XJH146]
MVNKNLKKAERILEVYSEFGQIGIWYCDKITKEEEVSEEWAAMIGYTFEELNPMNDDIFHSLIHPDDIGIIIEESNQLYSGKVKEYNCEFKIKHKDGYYIWVLSKAKIFSWEEGSPRLIVGTHINIDKQKKALEKIISQNHAIINTLSKVVEYKDEYTKNHMDNVAELAVNIGVEVGMGDEDLNNLWLSGKVHDLGKIKLPTDILNKPGKLNQEEYELAKTHSSVGHELLEVFDFGFPLETIVQQHHERLDGSGYPLGLKGEDISYNAQIIAVADIADAMLSDRVYRSGIPKKQVIEELVSYKDIYYKSEIIDACIKVIKQSIKY